MVTLKKNQQNHKKNYVYTVYRTLIETKPFSTDLLFLLTDGEIHVIPP